MTKQTEALLDQHAMIQSAIEFLQVDLDKMSDSIDPNVATWADVADFARTADIARGVVDQYQETDR
jgi:hypothetical protein